MISFMEKLISRNYDLNEEIKTIEKLMDQYTNNQNIRECINKNLKKWPHRNNFVDIQQIYSTMALDAVVTMARDSMQNVNIEVFLYYAEFIYNVVNIAYYYADYSQTRTKMCENVNIIKENIENILGSLNFKIHHDTKNNIYKIVQKDWKVEVAANIVQDNHNLGELIYDYNHFKIRGNLNEKSDKLCRLYKYIETIETKLKNNHYENIISDIGFLSDKLDIRHAAKGKEAKLLEGFNAIEQEKWYDTTFELCLEAIILSEYISHKPKINDLKRKYGELK